MKISKAVITAAGRDQQTLPLQTLYDRDGTEKSVLQIIVEEALRGGIEEICVVVQPGDEDAYAEVAGDHAGRLHFELQKDQLGYGHAIYCAREFVKDDMFLHLVGDHIYISTGEKSCVQKLIEVAEAEACAVSAVQGTRENMLPFFGAIGGSRVSGKTDLFRIETVLEKPTPTEAEERLMIPGMRAGYYMCFFGMHVLTPTIFDIIHELLNRQNGDKRVTLSDALSVLAKREQYLACGKNDLRYDVGVKYGLMSAQIALSLNGSDREDVLSRLLELLTVREMNRSGEGARQ